ncbi:unnamed protein product [Lasius platythorax]|uniref:Uncharacterized protein n=1 Tax=Lasius platythorax TaxID=488582 RepID=A0AAV2MXR6_9HYME
MPLGPTNRPKTRLGAYDAHPQTSTSVPRPHHKGRLTTAERAWGPTAEYKRRSDEHFDTSPVPDSCPYPAPDSSIPGSGRLAVTLGDPVTGRLLDTAIPGSGRLAVTPSNPVTGRHPCLRFHQETGDSLVLDGFLTPLPQAADDSLLCRATRLLGAFSPVLSQAAGDSLLRRATRLLR